MASLDLRVRGVAIAIAALLGVSGCAAADHGTDQQRAADRSLALRVEAALRADPYTYAEHVEVQVDRGVVRLSGSVADASELRSVLKICSAVPGVQRVDDQLEITDFGRSHRR